MTAESQRSQVPATTPGVTWRLDRLANPAGPIDRVLDDFSRFDAWHSQIDLLTQELKQRLGARTGVPASWVVLANGIDDLHAMIPSWRSPQGPAVTFSPTDL